MHRWKQHFLMNYSNRGEYLMFVFRPQFIEAWNRASVTRPEAWNRASVTRPGC
jgi:hypothetical protein